eukprot:5361517-Amphidinium_carterae.1
MRAVCRWLHLTSFAVTSHYRGFNAASLFLLGYHGPLPSTRRMMMHTSPLPNSSHYSVGKACAAKRNKEDIM